MATAHVVVPPIRTPSISNKKKKAEASEELLIEETRLPQPASVTPPGPALERRAVRDLFVEAEQRGMIVGATYYVVNFRWWQLWQHYVDWSEEDAAAEPGQKRDASAQQGNEHQRQRPGPIDNTELLEESSGNSLPLQDEEAASTSSMPGKESDDEGEEEEEEGKAKDDDSKRASGTEDDVLPSLGEELQLRRNLVKDVDYTLFPASVFKLIYSWYGCTPVIARQVITVGLFQKMQVELHPIVLLCYNKSATAHGGISRAIEEHRFSITAALKDVRRYVAGIYMIPPHKNLRLIEESALNQTLEDLGISSGQIIVLQSTGIDIGGGDRSYSSYTTARPSSWGYTPVGNTVGKPPARGATGLMNLGNTCFMNSALQCLSNTTPLLRFFLNDAHLTEINLTNPLGAKGEVAKKFGDLLRNLWIGKYTSVVPREFKSALSKFAPQFAGYQQHDSQELLSFVLDGIHEDLNRIREKPYTEKLEFSATDNNDAELAKISWNTHLARNNSVIVDHFHGQLKSTVVCQHCGHVSLTYDPFVYLSLPVPSKNQRIISVVLFWQYRNPVKYGIRVSKMGTIKDLKDGLARLVAIAPDQLVMAEIYTFRPFMIHDAKPLFDIRSSDLIFAYEVLPPGGEVMVLDKKKEEKATTPITQSPVKNEAEQKDAAQQGSMMEVESVASMEAKPNEANGMETAKNSVSAESLPPSPVYKSVNQIAHLPVFHRRFYTAKKFDLFGRPLIISFDRTSTTHNDIHRMIFERATRYLKLDLPGLHLSLVDAMGFGIGNDIPHNDELFVFEDGNTGIAVDWDRDVLNAIPTKQKEFEEHKSLQKTEADEELCVTLENCLDMFTSEEILEGGNPWFCSACKIHRPALKRISMWKCPPVLIIHLKRFQYTHVFRDKISSKVNFPVNGLDLTAYINEADPSMPPIYDLYAVSNHIGSLKGGHYTAFTKNPITKDWYKISDNVVTKVEKEENIITDSAYMLFYVNRSFHEQQGLEDITAWIGAEDAGGSDKESATVAEASHSASDSSNGRTGSLDRMDVVKAKEAESGVGYGERDSARSSISARGRRNSDGDVGETGKTTEMDIFRVWSDGERPVGPSAATSTIEPADYRNNDWGDSFMGSHRDMRGLLDFAMHHHQQMTNRTTEQGSGAGNSRKADTPATGGGAGRSQLRSSLYVCPKCDERVASLDDLQVHVLCTHPDSEDLLAVFCG